MKKNILLLSVIMLASINLYTTETEPVKFSSKKNSEILKWIDGIRYAMDGFAIKDIEKVKFQIDAIQYGLQNPKTKEVVGRYIVNKKRYTLFELGKLEKKGRMPTQESTEFDNALIQACKDFDMIVKPFHQRVQGLKKFLIGLIAESCSIRNRMDSLLLDWSQIEKNKQESLEHTIKKVTEKDKGFQTLNTFLNDLKTFFEDLKHNCPKACQQYEELKHQA